MKFIKSKLISKAKGNRKARYELTIEVTDYDIDMFEEFGNLPTASVVHDKPDKPHYKMNNYLKNVFKNVFHKLWREYDEK